MSRTTNTRRNTLTFLALGPVIGGFCMFLLLLVELEYPPKLSDLFSFGMIWVVIFFIIGGYVVGALPALAAGLIFAFVASRHALKLLHSILLGASAGLLTSAMTAVVIALINSDAPEWNWIIPGVGALAGALCGACCWILERRHGRSDAVQASTRASQRVGTG